jgi:hypothetical protein
VCVQVREHGSLLGAHLRLLPPPSAGTGAAGGLLAMLRKGGGGAAAGAPRETSDDVALDFTWRGDAFALSFAMQAAGVPGAGDQGGAVPQRVVASLQLCGEAGEPPAPDDAGHVEPYVRPPDPAAEVPCPGAAVHPRLLALAALRVSVRKRSAGAKMRQYVRMLGSVSTLQRSPFRSALRAAVAEGPEHHEPADVFVARAPGDAAAEHAVAALRARGWSVTDPCGSGYSPRRGLYPESLEAAAKLCKASLVFVDSALARAESISTPLPLARLFLVALSAHGAPRPARPY